MTYNKPTREIADRLVYRWRRQFSVPVSTGAKVLSAMIDGALEDERNGRYLMLKSLEDQRKDQ